MIRTLSLVAILAVGATAASAQNLDVIKQRQEVFKSFGGGAKTGTGFVRGQAKFDLAKAKAIFATYAQGAGKLKNLFPDNSKAGGNTEALPVIWEKKGDFVKLLAKLEGEATAAGKAVKDEASFKSEWQKVMGNCGGCHKVFRKPKS
ncbi:MAG: cytochrome c [Hyphomicrobiaceae bacterium]